MNETDRILELQTLIGEAKDPRAEIKSIVSSLDDILDPGFPGPAKSESDRKVKQASKLISKLKTLVNKL